MNTKHTPGPWKYATQKNGDHTSIRIYDEATGTVNTAGVSVVVNTEANARLIAAAPELLEACEELIEGMIAGEKHGTANVTLYAIGLIRTAIAKAYATQG